MERNATVKGHDHSPATGLIDAVTSASAAVNRGALGMNFNSCSEDYLSQCSGTLIVRERFQEEFDRFPDVGEDLLNGPALRLAPLEFRAPSVTAVLILLNYDTDFARHDLILT